MSDGLFFMILILNFMIIQLLKNNWKSGITVALVSLPLSISLAVAANATPVMGVITAFWAGLLAAIFGGSNYNIVGPTGALSGTLAAYALTHGMKTLPLLAALAGICIIIAYVFRLERYIVFIPSSVVHGFTLGVAFIIGLNQLNFALGLSGLPAHEKFIANVFESLKNLPGADAWTFSFFAIALIALFAFIKWAPKFPGPIALAPVGILIGYLATSGRLPFTLLTLSSRFGDISPKLFILPEISAQFFTSDLMKAVLTVAIVAILETLISAKIADAMTKTKFNQRSEVLGLGLANLASGLTGGIPATAALARTALNIKSGAQHKASAWINALVVGLIALVFLPYFKYLPLSVVAAILVYVAVRMVEGEHFIHLYQHDKTAFGISMLVAAITIIEDPIVGILVGAAISLLLFVKKLSEGQAEISVNKNKEMIARLYGSAYALGEISHGDVVVYRFSGPMTYVNAQSHILAISRINGVTKTIILSFRNISYIDIDGVDAITEIIEDLNNREVSVILTSIGEHLLPIVGEATWYIEKRNSNAIFESTAAALKTINAKI